jgi:hypothetical protein
MAGGRWGGAALRVLAAAAIGANEVGESRLSPVMGSEQRVENLPRAIYYFTDRSLSIRSWIAKSI